MAGSAIFFFANSRSSSMSVSFAEESSASSDVRLSARASFEREYSKGTKSASANAARHVVASAAAAASAAALSSAALAGPAPCPARDPTEAAIARAHPLTTPGRKKARADGASARAREEFVFGDSFATRASSKKKPFRFIRSPRAAASTSSASAPSASRLTLRDPSAFFRSASERAISSRSDMAYPRIGRFRSSSTKKTVVSSSKAPNAARSASRAARRTCSKALSETALPSVETSAAKSSSAASFVAPHRPARRAMSETHRVADSSASRRAARRFGVDIGSDAPVSPATSASVSARSTRTTGGSTYSSDCLSASGGMVAIAASRYDAWDDTDEASIVGIPPGGIPRASGSPTTETSSVESSANPRIATGSSPASARRTRRVPSDARAGVRSRWTRSRLFFAHGETRDEPKRKVRLEKLRREVTRRVRTPRAPAHAVARGGRRLGAWGGTASGAGTARRSASARCAILVLTAR